MAFEKKDVRKVALQEERTCLLNGLRVSANVVISTVRPTRLVRVMRHGHSKQVSRATSKS